MDFFEKYLKETLETIKSFRNGIITVKRIRVASNIKSANRSQINFIWRALKSLVQVGFLELNGLRKPQSYKLASPEKTINIDEIVSKVLRKRKNST